MLITSGKALQSPGWLGRFPLGGDCGLPGWPPVLGAAICYHLCLV